MEDKNKIKESMHEVFKCAGCVLLSAQFMEKELASLLFLPEVKNKQLPSKNEIKKVIDKLNKMTFGRLIQKLKNIGALDEISDKSFRKALDARNMLAHHFFDKYQGSLDDIETHKIMREELSEMKKLFDEMFEGFHKINFGLMKEVGICDENGELIPE